VRRGIVVARSDLRGIALEASARVPQRPPEVDVVEQRRLERTTRDVRRPVDELDAAYVGLGADRPLDAQPARLLDGASDGDVRCGALDRDVTRRQKRVRPVQADSLGRRADVVQPARRKQPAAPRLPPVCCLRSTFARGRDPCERYPAKPRRPDVEPAPRMDSQFDAAHDANVDGRSVGRERDLIQMSQALRGDHGCGNSTSKSTSIP
jgi:hypothetical protein